MTRVPLLQVRNLKKYYPIRKGVIARTVGQVRAVDDVSFDVYSGETLGIVGESGCGKSTTGRAILRLETPTAGSVIFEGADIATLSAGTMRRLRTDLQMVFQDPYSSLNPQIRIGDLLAEPLIAHHRMKRAGAHAKAAEIIQVVGLPRLYLNRYPHELSGGQRQRVGIARALMLEPKLIVCDEPVSALDVSIQAQVLNLLKDLQGEFGLTYVFISHGLGAIKYISDRIVVMYLGKVMEVGTTQEIFAGPRHPYTEILLDAYPEANPHLRDRPRIIVEGDVPSPAKPPAGCVFHTRCPSAQAICRSEIPRLSNEAHPVACHFPLSVSKTAEVVG
ncbi:ABC transporter ATP-binding protein [Kribbella sp. NPDC058245]|uniref:ABC transporter ATP-binding protein n=1 Tax=Kribbella sp. NPDC058245 TaxID=3346399 RepID=UPI0036E0E570